MAIEIIEGGEFCIACPTLKVGEATAPRLHRPCPVGGLGDEVPQKPKLIVTNHQ